MTKTPGQQLDELIGSVAKLNERTSAVEHQVDGHTEYADLTVNALHRIADRLGIDRAELFAPVDDTPVPDPTPDPEPTPQPQPEPTPTDGRTIEVRKGADEHAIRDAIGRLRDGYPDRLLFERGGTYGYPIGTWTKSGANVGEPLVVGAFGEGNLPTFRVFDDWLSLGNHAVSHVVFEDIRATAEGRDPMTRPYGVRWWGGSTDVTFRRLDLSHFAFNFDTARTDAGQSVMLSLLSNRFSFAHASWKSGHSQGVGIGRAAGVLFIGNVLDHNGWMEGVPECGRTGFNQNVYLNEIEGATIKGNVFSRASALGLKVRGDFAGASDHIFVHNNLFMDCLTGMSTGADEKDGDVDALTINVLDVQRNAFIKIGGVLKPGDPNEQGIAIDLKQTTNATIADNLFAHKESNNWPPVEACGDGKAFGSLAVEDNRLHDWQSTDGLMRGKAKGVVQRNNREVPGDGRGRDTDAIRERLLSGELAPGDAAGWVREGYEQ